METARLALANAKERLVAPTPKGLDECRNSLAEAVDNLRRLKTESQQLLPAEDDTASEAIQQMAAELNRDLVEIRGLLEQAGAFYLGWAQVLLQASGTYGVGGELHTPSPSAVSLEG